MRVLALSETLAAQERVLLAVDARADECCDLGVNLALLLNSLVQVA